MRRVSLAAYVDAIVVFLLAALGVDVSSLSELDLVAVGLALFTFAHVVP